MPNERNIQTPNENVLGASLFYTVFILIFNLEHIFAEVITFGLWLKIKVKVI